MTTKFVHVRSQDEHFGGATVAYDVVQNADGSVDKIVYAISACHDKDRYSKAKGRQIAGGRLTCARGNKVRVLSAIPDLSIVRQVMKDLYDLDSSGQIRSLL